MKITEAVILLGGMGTRLLPITKTVSKEMLPVYDVPNIFLLVEEAYLSGIREIIFVVTRHNKKLIESFFKEDKYLNDFIKDKPEKKRLIKKVEEIISKMNFKFVYQQLKGTYGALYSARKYLKNDYFLVMYGDDLIDSTIPLSKQLIDSFKQNKMQQIAIQKKSKENLPNVGLVVFDKEKKLVDLKPINETNSCYVMHGRMILNKKVFNLLKHLNKHANDEYYLSYALLYCDDVYCFEYNGEYFNLGDKIGFIKASIHYALKDNKVKKDLVEYINTKR